MGRQLQLAVYFVNYGSSCCEVTYCYLGN